MILRDLEQNDIEATVIKVDNKSTISMAKNPVQHGRSKHINVKFHAIRQAKNDDEVKLVHCSSNQQIANIMTKALFKGKFEVLRAKLGAVVGCILEEQDRFMPDVGRITHRTLPPHTKISDDSKRTMHEYVHWVISKFGFDEYIEPLPLYLPRYREHGGGERGSLIDESLLKHPIVDAASGCNITPYHPPRNFPMAHHHFVYPPPMGSGDMQGDASNASTSQCVMDSDVESPTEDVRSDQFLY
ncbi:hypothetical protein MTR67_022158 [Solanum verrucosum]|uniref:Uncharacterized protein n=1 Tax=Solanum verrucosum TaxID=315347 RepID=A0AAF0QUT4_SOLVR|nr:hypothetical protein MTR67_022158 [Solanum verrucosum]